MARTKKTARITPEERARMAAAAAALQRVIPQTPVHRPTSPSDLRRASAAGPSKGYTIKRGPTIKKEKKVYHNILASFNKRSKAIRKKENEKKFKKFAKKNLSEPSKVGAEAKKSAKKGGRRVHRGVYFADSTPDTHDPDYAISAHSLGNLDNDTEGAPDLMSADPVTGVTNPAEETQRRLEGQGIVFASQTATQVAPPKEPTKRKKAAPKPKAPAKTPAKASAKAKGKGPAEPAQPSGAPAGCKWVLKDKADGRKPCKTASGAPCAAPKKQYDRKAYKEKAAANVRYKVYESGAHGRLEIAVGKHVNTPLGPGMQKKLGNLDAKTKREILAKLKKEWGGKKG